MCIILIKIMLLIGVYIIAQILLANHADAQNTSSGDLGQGWGMSIASNIGAIDTTKIMTVTCARDSITSLKAQLATKIALTALSITTVGTSGAAVYNSATGIFNIPQYAAAASSFNTSPSRLLSTTGTNNTFTISSTKNARVHYTVNFAFALTLTTSNGYVELDYSTDGGTTWVICGSVSNVFSLSITIAGNQDAELVGEIPANALVRLYRVNATNVTVTLPVGKQLEITY